MKAVILAGGFGSRLSEETALRPKPMVEVGGMPILWHIMKIYAAHGIDDFVVCLGYKGYVIKEWFANYALHTSDVTFDMRSGEMEVHHSTTEPWRVTLVETGADSMTGGRLKRVMPYLDDDFCFTYGDGVADIDVTALVAHHRAAGVQATLTAVQPAGRFGALGLDGEGRVTSFEEKPRGDGAWTNGGFFVLSPSVVEYLHDDATIWEQGPVRELAARGQLSSYKHTGYWQAMDTIRDRAVLEELWSGGSAPWRVW